MVKFPLTVGLMDDDPFALQLNASLLVRDRRTTCSMTASTPQELKAKLQNVRAATKKGAPGSIDVFVLDVEYLPNDPSLKDLIRFIKERMPNGIILCLSQYGNPSLVGEATRAGAHGFLLKSEIKFSTAAAIVRACRKPFVFTAGVRPALREKFENSLRDGDMLQPFTFHLTHRQRQVLELCLIHGMSAPQIAKEFDLAAETIEKYRTDAYEALKEAQAGEADWAGIDLKHLKPEDRAFLLFTALRPSS